MAIPEKDMKAIERWAEIRVPVDVRDKLRIEVDVDGHRVTILQCHPPWTEWMGKEWTRTPVARLRWVQRREEWDLYWPDRNGDFHEYDLLEPSRDVKDLLAEVDDDPTAIFWG